MVPVLMEQSLRGNESKNQGPVARESLFLEMACKPKKKTHKQKQNKTLLKCYQGLTILIINKGLFNCMLTQ